VDTLPPEAHMSDRGPATSVLAPRLETLPNQGFVYGRRRSYITTDPPHGLSPRSGD
jgi:hypothetical protein